MMTTDEQVQPRGDFTERLVHGFFRRWVLYTLPVVLFVAIGVSAAGRITETYRSAGQLGAATNPYVSQPAIRGTEIAYYETPASGTARLISEQLQTDLFIDEVAARAGLAGALESGSVARDDLRRHISVSAVGTNNLSVGADWADPDTAFQLVDSTISGYRDYLAGVAAADSAEAIEFWTQRLQDAQDEVRSAQEQLDEYVGALPAAPDGARTTEEVLTIQRLNGAVDAAIESQNEAQSSIDDAEFAESQARSESSRVLRLIDPPTVATAPTSATRDRLITVAMYTLLGVAVAAAALVLTTVFDRSIRSKAQLVRLTGTNAVVIIPRAPELRSTRRTSGEEKRRVA